MINEEYIEKFKQYKIAALDAAFEGTNEKKGYHETRLALKYVLLNEKNNDIDTKIDKYLYISNRYAGRELLKLVNDIDIIQILAKFAMQYFGLFNKKFKLTKESYKNIRQNKEINLEDNELIEFIAFASYNDHFETYYLLTKHKNIRSRLFDLLLEYRYKNNLKNQLDNYEGNLNEELSYKKQYFNLNECYNEIRNML